MSKLSNLCLFIGNVGREPEMRYTSSGMAVLNLSLATDTFKKKADGSYEKGTQWVRVTLFDKSAERANEYVQKGYKLAVLAHFRSTQYTTEGGQSRWSNEFIVDDWTIVGYPRGSEGDAEDVEEQPDDGSKYEKNDDIPF